MTPSEYFNVFESIFYGLILTQCLAGWNKMIRDFGTYQFYWAHFLLTIVLFLAPVQRYYGKFLHWGLGYEDIGGSLDLLYFIVLMPSMLFIAVAQVFPKNIEGVDLKEFCLRIRWKFTIPIAIYLIVQIISNIRRDLGLEWLIPHFLILITGVTGSILRNIRWLEVSIVLSFLAVCFYLWIS